MIRGLTESAWSALAVHHQEEIAGRATREQAQAQAIQRIRNQRYGTEMKDYFWIIDKYPRVVMHPYRPELEKQDITHYADPKGKYVFREAIKAVEKNGAGYVEYMWQWKDDPNRIVPKLSYVKSFEPWGWIIGTGIYLEDVRAEIASVRRKLTVISLVILGLTALLSAYIIWQGLRTEERRKQAEEEKRKLEEQLHQAQKIEAVGQLAGGVAHDFNNLLTVILGNTASIARELPKNASTHAAVETIEQAARQATGVTRSLLTFSRKVAAEKTLLDLRQIISETCRFLCRTLPASIELVTEIASDQPLWVNANETQLQQIVLNLAINARDAMENHGTLHIALSKVDQRDTSDPAGTNHQADACVHLVIRDTGPGMAPEIQSRIFEPFFTTKSPDHGTGLGLSVTHGLVRDHGGQIEVQSEIGKGTTFAILLPCAKLNDLASADTQNSNHQKHQNRTVLLAEPRQFVREVMTSTLHTLGHEVIHACDTLSLLQSYREHQDRITLLILDMDLPPRGATAGLDQIRAEGFSSPTIVVTGEMHNVTTNDLGDKVFLLSRPFQVNEFQELVQDIVGKA